ETMTWNVIETDVVLLAVQVLDQVEALAVVADGVEVESTREPDVVGDLERRGFDDEHAGGCSVESLDHEPMAVLRQPAGKTGVGGERHLVRAGQEQRADGAARLRVRVDK